MRFSGIAVLILVAGAWGCSDPAGGNTDPGCPDGCKIGAVCYPPRVTNPDNGCQVCAPSRDAEAWSNNDGQACDDGLFCTVGDACLAGQCVGSDRECDDGTACNGAETCDEAADRCTPGASRCGEFELCDVAQDVCVETCVGCVIDHLCYPQGTAHPTNPCLACDAGRSVEGWSDDDGAPCDDGILCNGADTCQGGTCSSHTGDPCVRDATFCNGVEACDEPSGECLSPGTPCAPGDTCHEDEGQCCRPNAYVACNAAGDVALYDSCDHQLGVYQNCAAASARGTCHQGECGCQTGWFGSQCTQCVRYVDGANGHDGNSGYGWQDAKATVQSAVSAAELHGCQVWVKEGTYPGPITLLEGVALYGGFTGSEGSWRDRVAGAVTTLDGQLGATVVTCSSLTGCGDNVLLDGFTVTRGKGANGGGMYIYQTSPLVRNCRFVSNSADLGGGVYVANGAPRFEDCVIEANVARDGQDGSTLAPAEAGGDGGGIYVINGQLGLTRCSLRQNRAGDGGDGQQGGDSSYVGRPGSIGGTGGYGGGLFSSGSSLVLTGCSFEQNRAGNGGKGGQGGDGSYFGGRAGPGGPGRDGGAAWLTASAAVLTNCRLNDNRAGHGGTGGLGGAAYSLGAQGGLGGNGGAAGQGGAIKSVGGALAMTNVTLWHNASGDGGRRGLGGPGEGSPGVSGQHSAGGSGGGWYSDDTAATVVNCTVAGNRTGETLPEVSPFTRPSGGGLYVSSGAGSLTNTILWGNSASSASQIASTTWTVSYSDVDTGDGSAAYPGEGNINTDPLFVEAALGDLRLQQGSPCVDAGSASALPVDALDLDGDGDTEEPIPYDQDNRRRENQTVDMGAHEYVRVVYVKQDATGLGDGSSWQNAYPDLQDALAAASVHDTLWVAEGVYVPTGGLDRAASFRLAEGLALYGGFGGHEVSPEDRDLVAHPTLLSGDLSGDDTPGANRSDNAYTVVVGAHGAHLDGFIITGGNADGPSPHDAGGGLRLEGGAMSVAHCTFTSNSAVQGGGMYVTSAWASIRYSVFSGNSASQFGGGLMVDDTAASTLHSLTFSGNTALDGAGVYLRASAQVTNGVFLGNTALRDGGGLYASGGTPALTNCTLWANTAAQLGGALYSDDGTAIASNSILWGNDAADGAQVYGERWAPIVSYSDVEMEDATALYPGQGNTNADPYFQNAPGGDLRLMGHSPCVDGGDNTTPGMEGLGTDHDGLPRVVDGQGTGARVVDLGAYEYQPAL